MGLGQTNLALLLKSWGAGSAGLSWETQCFGKSRAGRGLSLKLGIAVGDQHCPGEPLHVHLCPARWHPPAEATALAQYQDQYFVRKMPFPVVHCIM